MNKIVVEQYNESLDEIGNVTETHDGWFVARCLFIEEDGNCSFVRTYNNADKARCALDDHHADVHDCPLP
jgi:hypothetical protein